MRRVIGDASVPVFDLSDSEEEDEREPLSCDGRDPGAETVEVDVEGT